MNNIVTKVILKTIKQFAKVWMWMDTTTNITSKVDFKREEPYILLGNHVYSFDVVQLAIPFKKDPIIVSSEFLMSVKGLKFVLKRIAKTIPKSKGSSDLRTAKAIIRAVKNNNAVMIMPEGDATYFGETGYIEEATAKLIKKLKTDVIVGKFHGGYLSKPRWALGKRKRRYVELGYEIVIKGSDIPDMTSDEIYEIIKKALYNNDYDWQREVMHPYGGRNLAVGIDSVLYKCPECGAINSIVPKGNNLSCTSCNTTGHIDKFGFIKGFKFDNLVDWNNYQKQYTDELRASKFSSNGELFFFNSKDITRTKPVKVSVAYHENTLFIKGDSVETIKVEDIYNPVLTMRRNLSFDYKETTYIIKLDRYAMSFLRACQSKY